MRYAKFTMSCFAGVMAFVTTGSPSARDVVRSVVTTEAGYRSDAPEIRQVQRWLLEHAAYRKDEMVGDPRGLGDVQIVYTAHRPGAAIAPPGDGAPAPVPSTGQPGDTISITSRSGGWTQSWSYAWGQGTWTLTAYGYHPSSTHPR